MNVSPVSAAVLWLLMLAASPAMAAPEPAKEEAAEPTTEAVLLGRFRIRDMRAAEGIKLRLNFALYAEVDSSQAEQVKQIEQLIEQRKNRVRSEVIIAIRTAEQSDFQEPGLERLRRRIFVRLRRTEPRLPVQELLIGEFEYFTD